MHWVTKPSCMAQFLVTICRRAWIWVDGIRMWWEWGKPKWTGWEWALLPSSILILPLQCLQMT